VRKGRKVTERMKILQNRGGKKRAQELPSLSLDSLLTSRNCLYKTKKAIMIPLNGKGRKKNLALGREKKALENIRNRMKLSAAKRIGRGQGCAKNGKERGGGGGAEVVMGGKGLARSRFLL